MRRRAFVQAGCVVFAGLQGCSSLEQMGSPASMPSGASKTASVVDSLSSQFGVTPQQATAGVGSMLGYARSQLSPTDFATVSKALPGADTYLTAATAVLGGTSGINTPAALGSAFSKIGMSPEMVMKFAPVVADYAGQYGGPAAKSLLATVFK